MFMHDVATSWVWTEAGAQPHVEEALSIGGFGYPVRKFLSCFLL